VVTVEMQLPPMESKPTKNRSFRFYGRSLAEGVLLIEGERESDLYLWEKDPEQEGTVLIANQTDADAEIYSVSLDRCSCKGYTYHRRCKHKQVLELLKGVTAGVH